MLFAAVILWWICWDACHQPHSRCNKAQLMHVLVHSSVIIPYMKHNNVLADNYMACNMASNQHLSSQAWSVE